jgi:signal transduction histidine kinase
MIAIPSLLLAALLGLVPGVRELEVTGARSMLGADGELLIPRRPRAAHHLRTALWVVLHLLCGLLCAVLLATFVPSAALHLVELAVGRGLGSGLPLPSALPGRFGAAVLALLVGAASLLAWWPLGAGLGRLAPRLLGPTAADRLETAELRVAREAERIRIARELHDGIGHALTVVSVQAAAARTVQQRDPEATAAALAAIEETARSATGELDAVLALLREEEQGRRRPLSTASQDAGADLEDDLGTLLERHRRAGMDLRRRGDLPAGLAPLQRRHLLRGLAELLANAQRHGGPGPVHLELGGDEDRVRLEVMSPLPADRADRADPADPAGSAGPVGPARPAGPDDPAGSAGSAGPVDPAAPAVSAGAAAPSGGHGLVGLRERAALLGGTLEAGPRGARWVAVLDLPLLREEGR